MKSMMRKTTVREIKNSFGRYFAILAIVALGVGFFAGLKMSMPDMHATADDYFEKLQLFDYRMLSTLGFEDSDVEAARAQADVRSAEGSVSFDIAYVDEAGNESVMKVYSVTEDINGLSLVAGRIPEKADECVVDSNLYDETAIGEKIVFSEKNEEEDLEQFAYKEYTIAGVARSSYYVNFERGNTSLGNGKISGFMYIPIEGFDVDYYTEIFVKFDEDLPIYSDEYENYMDAKEAEWENFCEQLAMERYTEIKTEAETELADAEQELADKKADAEKELADAEQELKDGETELADGEDKLNTARQELEDKEKELDAAEAQLKTAEEELAAQEAQVAQMEQIPQMAEQAAVARGQLEAAKAQLNQSKTQIASGRTQIKEGKETLAEEEVTLAEAKQELADGWEEYNEAKAEFDEQIADAEAEIADAREEIAKIEEPDTYVLGRETNVGYACFESDSSIIEGIANVFPVFFFLVAALVCMTTMNRMVEEQRTQIGILKALGYGEASIMGKYMFYSGSAAVVGCVGGFFGGTWLFPTVIWYVYGIMYSMQNLVYVFDWKLATVSLTAALLCSIGVTWYTCHHELALVAAELMRPKAPKAGKRVFMEYLPFIWKRLKFLQKVSIRNVVRYKKRFFMMIIGISGCTALLVTGFGVKDSVADVAKMQYGEIQLYDMSISFSNPQESADNVFAEKAEELKGTYVLASEKTMDLVVDGNVKSVNMIIPEKEEGLGEFIDLHTEKGEALSYPGENEVVITNSLAEEFGLNVGEEIILRDDNLKEIKVKISGIAQNFVYNYVYLNCDTYEKQLGEMPEFKNVYLNFPEETDVHMAAVAFMKMDDVTSATVSEDVKERFDSMMASLDSVVILIIACAAVLAFIVLYNLTNINITERIREIATIKVLGFYKKETSSYVFRENIVLTGIGGIIGLGLGVLLHRFVMSQVKIDMVSFAVQIKPISYVYSLLFTFLFAMIINSVMSVKLEKINMAESLKSVD